MRNRGGILAPACLTTAAAIAIYWAAGVSLDLFLAPLVIAAVITPPLALRTARGVAAVAVSGTIVAIFAAMVFIPVTQHAVSFLVWIQCVFTLAAFTAIAAAAPWLLKRLGVHEILASAISTVFLLAWLSWPIWASGWINVKLVDKIVSVHPLFAINSVCRELGIWTEQPIAYHLTTLGQDIPYRLPSTAWPCVLAQIILVGILICFTMIAQKSRPTLNVPE